MDGAISGMSSKSFGLERIPELCTAVLSYIQELFMELALSISSNPAGDASKTPALLGV